ncbi:MAG TPA: group 1 truncated hemoglobin [Candidatus Limnocylindria bacterium]|nr:group 1 truncated hemoglobin [Candidatus Limnocylindria bacterium]
MRPANRARTDIPRFDAMLIDQVCEATGGPYRYTGRTMRDAHRGMQVTTGEFNALVEDLVATLSAFKVPKAEQDELLGILGPLKTDIVEVQSNATATALGHGSVVPAARHVAIERSTPRRSPASRR